MSTLSSQITVLGSQPAVSFATPAELGNLPELTAELALLESGDSAARFPLALQCSACSSYFVWLATRIRCAEDLDLPRLDELTESVSMLRFNFIATVDEAVWCPACKRVDDYVLIADPSAAIDSCITRLRKRTAPGSLHLPERLRVSYRPPGASGRHRTLVSLFLEVLGRAARGRGDASSWLRLAALCTELRQSTRALSAAGKSLELEPLGVEALQLSGAIHTQQRAWVAALTVLRLAADLLGVGRGVMLQQSAERMNGLVSEDLKELRRRAPALWTEADEGRLERLE